MPNQTNQISLPTQFVYVDGWGQNIPRDTGAYTYRYRARDWTTTAGFRGKVKGRKKTVLATLPMNPYTDNRSDLSLDSGALSWRQPGVSGAFSISGNALCVTDKAVPALTDAAFGPLYTSCIGKLPRFMNGNSFNLPVFLAEARKTSVMVAEAATDVVKAFKRQKTGRKIHNTWLEYRYGWRLAVKDIYDAMVAIHDMRTRGVKQRVSAVSTSKVVSTVSSFEQINLAAVSLKLDTDFVTEITKEYYTKITLQYVDSGTMSTLQQFGITNPALVAWELVPYSFVIDWLIPVGDYLQTLDAFIGKSFVSGCVSKFVDYKSVTRVTKQVVSQVSRPGATMSGTGTLPRSQQHYRFYQRSALTTFPQAQLPSINPNLNASRYADAIALGVQQLPTLRRAWRARDKFTE